MILEVKGLVKQFGGVAACADISLALRRGEIVGLIGPNGAGKTTLFNCIAGYTTPTAGKVYFSGEDITGWPAHRVAQLGIGRTFQIIKAMPNLTVEENVMIGAFCRSDDRRVARKEAREILELLDLAAHAGTSPADFPIATQKRIELARALATKPRLLMLDEVAAGLNPLEITEITHALQRVREEKDLTLLLTEHVMEFVMAVCQRIVVMAAGKKIAEGPPEEVARERKVIEAYLGEKYAKSR
jgi:branched-chain amino acid transport system ATP-binding protein